VVTGLLPDGKGGHLAMEGCCHLVVETLVLVRISHGDLKYQDLLLVWFYPQLRFGHFFLIEFRILFSKSFHPTS